MAAHYVEAFEATPDGPDADALAARARDWLRQASDRAVSLGSAEQALAFTPSRPSPSPREATSGSPS